MVKSAFLLVSMAMALAGCATRENNVAALDSVRGAETGELEFGTPPPPGEELPNVFATSPQQTKAILAEVFAAATKPALVWDDELPESGYRSSVSFPFFLTWYTGVEVASLLGRWLEEKKKQSAGDGQGVFDSEDPRLWPVPSAAELEALIPIKKREGPLSVPNDRLRLRRFAKLFAQNQVKKAAKQENADEMMRGYLAGTQETVLYSPLTARHLLANYRSILAHCNRQDFAPKNSEEIARLAAMPRQELLEIYGTGVGFLGKEPCLTTELPIGSATARVLWSPVTEGTILDVYDQEGVNVQDQFRVTEGNIHKLLVLQFPGQDTVKMGLLAFHIGLKSVREHLWTTFCWNPNGKQSHFLSCGVAGFGGTGRCANPYLETLPNSRRTNCVGCHQHAGTSVDQALTYQNEVLFPDYGNSQVRTSYPGDFLWSLVNIRREFIGVKGRLGL